MCSTPPASTTSTIPTWIMAIPERTVSIPEMQTRFGVTAGTLSGTPTKTSYGRPAGRYDYYFLHD